MSFERSLLRLEEIVEILDRADLPLDEALALFEQGVDALRTASAELARAEAEVKRLVEESDGTFHLDDLGG